MKAFVIPLCLLLLLTGCHPAGASLPKPWQDAVEQATSVQEQEAPAESEPPLAEKTAIEENEFAEILYSPAEGFAVRSLFNELEERITGNSWQENDFLALEDLSYLTLLHLDFEGNIRQGEMIVHHTLAREVADIFWELYQAEYPIHRVSLVEEFDCDDAASMEANNTSCFNMRLISGTRRPSHHSYGSAVDLNPLQNPYVTASAVLPSREYLERGDARPGMITEGDLCYEAFVSRGWSWGGYWPNPDYQHFEKPVESARQNPSIE